MSLEPIYTATEGQLMAGIAAVQAQVAAFQEQSRSQNEIVVGWLGKLNGKIADHEKRIGEMQIELAERRNACPVVEKFAEVVAKEVGGLAAELKAVQHDLDERKGEARSSATWMKYVWPVIYGFIGITLCLAFLHGRELTSHAQRMIP